MNFNILWKLVLLVNEYIIHKKGKKLSVGSAS